MNPTFVAYNTKTDQIAELVETSWIGNVYMLEDIPENSNGPILRYSVIFDDQPESKDFIKIGEL